MAPDSAETLVELVVITSFALVVSGSMPTATTRLERRDPGATGWDRPSRGKNASSDNDDALPTNIATEVRVPVYSQRLDPS